MHQSAITKGTNWKLKNVGEEQIMLCLRYISQILFKEETTIDYLTKFNEI